ncbi:polyprotein [gallivirus A1]|uniref:Genome polyprotein n=1 Tax=gallivirus A1 TaxID=2764087 RepID=I7C489_9PICO|nr:polyprotein [gallivirus A1]AFO66657.1 polyprotein [gallivirus A1]
MKLQLNLDFLAFSTPGSANPIPLAFGVSGSKFRRLALAHKIVAFSDERPPRRSGSYLYPSLPKPQYTSPSSITISSVRKPSESSSPPPEPLTPPPEPEIIDLLEECDSDFQACLLNDDLEYYYKNGVLPFSSCLSYDDIYELICTHASFQGNITYNVTGNNNSFDTDQGLMASGSVAATGHGNASATDVTSPDPIQANATKPTKPKPTRSIPSKAASFDVIAMTSSRGVDTPPSTTRSAENPASILQSARTRNQTNAMASDVKAEETGFVTFDTMAYANRAAPWPDPPEYDPPNLGPPIIGGPLADSLQIVTSYSWTLSSEPAQPLRSTLGAGWVERGDTDQNKQNPRFPLGSGAPETAPTTGHVIYLPSAIVISNPNCVFSRLYTSNRFYQCGFTVQVCVNANPGMSGILKITCKPSAASGFDNWNGFSTPSVLLNLSEANTATLTLPPFFPRGAGVTGIEDSWCVVITTVVEPRLGLMAGELNVNLAVAPRNSRFWLTAAPNTQGLVTMPAAGSGDGYTYSAQTRDFHPVMQAPPPLPHVDHLPGQISSFSELAMCPSSFRNRYYSIPKCFWCKDAVISLSGAEILSHTGPLSSAFRAFSQWRGDLILDLVAATSQTASGRLIVSYTPPGFAAPSRLTDLSPSAKHLWDLTSCSSVSILIPNCFPGGWVPTLPCTDPQKFVVTMLGFVSIFVENPLLDLPQTSEGYSIVAYVRAAPNFELRGCSNQLFQSESQAPQGPSLDDDDFSTYLSYVSKLNSPSTFPMTNASKEMFYEFSPDKVAVVPLDASFFLYGCRSIFSYTTSNVGDRADIPADTDWCHTAASWVCRNFSAFSADLGIRFTFLSHTEGKYKIQWAYLPPGASQCLSGTVFSSPYSGSFIVDVEQANLPLYVPCMLPRNVFQLHPPQFPAYYRTGISPTSARTFGTSVDEFGSFQFLVTDASQIATPQPASSTNLTVLMNIELGFFNFKGFGLMPQYSPIKTNTPFYQPPCFLSNARIPSKRQGGEAIDISGEPVYVIRAPRPTYVHWALRQGDQQISLTKKGIQAVVSYEPCTGDIWALTTHQAWHMAKSLIGDTLPYHAFRNCTHFVEALTGYNLQNSGLGITLGLGAAAVATASVGVAKTLLDAHFRSLPQPRPRPQGPLDKTVEASENVMKAATIASGAAASLESSIKKIEPTIKSSMDKIESSAKALAGSINKFTDLGEKLVPAVQAVAGEAQGVLGKFLMWITKIIGYIMIIFGSPTPLSIAGLITVIAADLAPGLVTLASNTSPIQSLVAWISSKLGIRTNAQEIADQFAGDEPDAPDQTDDPAPPPPPPPQNPAPQPQGVKDYNDWMNAFKNTDWAIEKILKIVERILNWIGIKIREDPATKLAEVEDKIFLLYNDSISALSHPDPNQAAIRSNLKASESLLSTAAKAKSPVHCQMVTQAVRNYNTRMTALTNNVPAPRPEPVVLYIYGPPGTGKSLLATLLASIFAYHLSGDPNDVFSQPPGSYEYFDGYHGQSVHIVDDIGQAVDGSDWVHFPQMVSTSPFKPPMAALEDKGMLYRSRVIICTSNFPGPTKSAVRCHQALERRLALKLKVDALPDCSFDIRDALTPDGPSTRHFTSDCPFLRLETCRLTVDMANVGDKMDFKFRHVDQIVDEVLLMIQAKHHNINTFKHLIPTPRPLSSKFDTTQCKQTSLGLSCPPLFENDRDSNIIRPLPQGKIACNFQNPPTTPSDEDVQVQSSIPTEVEEAIRENKPLSFVQKVWSWRKPIFVGTAVLSMITSLSVLFSLTYRYFRSKSQGAYTGTPSVKAKPEPAPRRNLPARPRRQGIVGYNPTIVNNTVGGVSTNAQKTSTFTAIGIGERYFVTADHVVLDNMAQLTIGDTSYPAYKVFSFRQLCVLHAPEAPQMKILERFIKDCNSKIGYLVASFPRGNGYIQVSNAQWVVSDCPEITSKECYHYSCVSFSGLCGAPLVLSTPAGPRLVGVHVAGVAGVTGYADPLVDLLHAFKDAMPQSLIVDIPRSGPPAHVPRKTKLTHSPAWGAFEPTKEPAALLNHDRRLPDGVTVDEVAFSKQNRGDVVEPWPGLTEAADLYFSQCNFPRLKMLTMDEAINGTEGLDGIDMNQSPGYPWNQRTSRRELFILNEDGRYEPVEELKLAVLKLLQDPDYWYSTFLKDELRKTEKARAGKTRLVEAAPIDAIIAGRMIFGQLFALFHSNPGMFGSAVGCDPDFHWTPFAHSFKPFRNVWSLDYSCFDSTLPSVCFNHIGSRLQDIIEVTEECHPDIVPKYINSIRASKHVFGARAYVMIGGMPSGAVGTSIFNSMINNICVLSALISRPDFVPTPNNYRILAYGDDVLYACTPDFHPRDLKAFYDKWTPLQVTPATKEGDFPNSSSLSDVTFLKRWFVPDETIPYYYHPVIEPDTYEQSVMWSRGGEFQDTVTSLCFLAHHAGPRNYTNWIAAVRDACKRNGYDPPIFLEYSYLQMRWMQLVSG